MIAQATPAVSSVRGITGRIRIETDQSIVQGRPDLDLDSPLLVRVAAIEPLENGRTAFDLEFIGMDVGVFDLRDVLVVAGGQSADSLQPIPIEILSKLGEDAPTDVYLATSPPNDIPVGYWTVLFVLAFAWILVPLIVLARRMHQPTPEEESHEDAPTVLDRIRPLVEAASQRQLSISEQGQLELLLYAHWQEALGLGDDRAEAIRSLRIHKDGGRILRAVEEWLHAPDQSKPKDSDIDALLLPYGSSQGKGTA